MVGYRPVPYIIHFYAPARREGAVSVDFVCHRLYSENSRLKRPSMSKFGEVSPT